MSLLHLSISLSSIKTHYTRLVSDANDKLAFHFSFQCGKHNQKSKTARNKSPYKPIHLVNLTFLLYMMQKWNLLASKI